MSRRRIAIAVGILFAVQMITAVFGTSLIQAFVDGNTDRARMTTGVVLMPIWLITKGFAPARPVHPAQPQPV